MDEAKTGNRNNSTDRATIRRVRALAREIEEHTMILEPTDADPVELFTDPGKTFIFDGGEVKALGEGRVGGYLVRFSTDDDPDLSGEYFAPDTDFGEAKTVSVYYHHGLDATLGKRKIGRAEIGADDVGVWIRAQLEMRDSYEQSIYALAEQGKLGWSSGTAAHVADREPTGKAVKIIAWPIVEASLTPTPCEPRNGAVPLKSLLPEEQELPEAGEPAAIQPPETKTIESEPTPLKEEIEMEITQEQLNEMVAQAVKAALPPIEPAPAPATKAAPAVHMTPTADNETAVFMRYMKTGDEGAMREINTEYKANPWNEGTTADGGIIVPNEFYSRIVEKRNPRSIIRQAPGALILQSSSMKLQIAAQDARQAAFVATAEESGTYDASNVTPLADKTVQLFKYSRLVTLSSELLADAKSNIEQHLANVLGAAQALTENNYVCVGAGTTEPTGITVGGTAGISQSSSTSTYTAAEINTLYHKLPSEYQEGAVWVTRNANLGLIRGLTGNPFSFISTPSGNLNGGLMGKDVLLTDSIVAAATAAKSLVIGNFEYYAFVENGGMMIQRNPYLLMNTDQVGFYAKIRIGGTVLQAEAFQYLGHATA